MTQVKRVTANLPAALLEAATAVTGGGITETLVAGLELVKRSRVADKARALRGKVHLQIDLEVSRERHRR
jgi:hypothetical protein